MVQCCNNAHILSTIYCTTFYGLSLATTLFARIQVSLACFFSSGCSLFGRSPLLAISHSQCPDDTVAVVIPGGQCGDQGWYHGHNWQSLVAPCTGPLTVTSMDPPLVPTVPIKVIITHLAKSMDDILLNDHSTNTAMYKHLHHIYL